MDSIGSFIITNTKPGFGFWQPGCGGSMELSSNPLMGKNARKLTHPAIRDVFAKNVSELMATKLRDYPNKPKTLADMAGVSLSSVQRVLTKEVGASLDLVQAFAAALQVPPSRLVSEEGEGPDEETLLLASRVLCLDGPYRMQLLGRLLELEGIANAANFARIANAESASQSRASSIPNKVKEEWARVQQPPPKREKVQGPTIADAQRPAPKREQYQGETIGKKRRATK